MKKTGSIFTTRFARVLAAGAMLMASGNGMAANLVQNGSFEINGGVGQVGGPSPKSTLANWTVGSTVDGAPYPFTFVIDKNADSTGFPSPFSPPNILIWGPNTPVGTSDPAHSYPGPGSHPVGPVANGWGTIPDGDFAFGADAAYANAPISQLISGFTVGVQYTLSFKFAGAQFTDALGPNTEGWHVTLGSDVNTDTITLNNASQGFTGWNTFSTTFTASTSSQTLTFLATGGPLGLPPFALLDAVSIDTPPSPPPAVPDPSTIVLIGSSLFLIGAARSFRKKNETPAV